MAGDSDLAREPKSRLVRPRPQTLPCTAAAAAADMEDGVARLTTTVSMHLRRRLMRLRRQSVSMILLHAAGASDGARRAVIWGASVIVIGAAAVT